MYFLWFDSLFGSKCNLGLFCYLESFLHLIMAIWCAFSVIKRCLCFISHTQIEDEFLFLYFSILKGLLVMELEWPYGSIIIYEMWFHILRVIILFFDKPCCYYILFIFLIIAICNLRWSTEKWLYGKMQGSMKQLKIWVRLTKCLILW